MGGNWHQERGPAGHLDRARECAQGQRPSEERGEDAEGQQKGEEMLPVAATPALNLKPFSPHITRADEEVWPCLQATPHPPRHMGCWPQAPFLQQSQPPHQLRGLLAEFWRLLWPQGSAEQLRQGVQLPCQCVNPLLQGLV